MAAALWTVGLTAHSLDVAAGTCADREGMGAQADAGSYPGMTPGSAEIAPRSDVEGH